MRRPSTSYHPAYSTSLLPYWYQQEGDGRARAITLTDQLPLELAKQYIPQVTVVAPQLVPIEAGAYVGIRNLSSSNVARFSPGDFLVELFLHLISLAVSLIV